MSFDVKLASVPSANVTVTIKLVNSADTASAAYTPAVGATANGTELTFTSANWSTPQTVVADITLDVGMQLRKRTDTNGAVVASGVVDEDIAAAFPTSGESSFLSFLELKAASVGDVNMDGGVYAIALYDVRKAIGGSYKYPIVLTSIPTTVTYDLEMANVTNLRNGAEQIKQSIDSLKSDLLFENWMQNIPGKDLAKEYNLDDMKNSYMTYLAELSKAWLGRIQSAADRMPSYIGMKSIYLAFKPRKLVYALSDTKDPTWRNGNWGVKGQC